MPAINKKPELTPVKRLVNVTAGKEYGYDLSPVPTDYLIAELIRRGWEPKLEPKKRGAKK